MRTNPFDDAWFFLIGRTGDHDNSGIGSGLNACRPPSPSPLYGCERGTRKSVDPGVIFL